VQRQWWTLTLPFSDDPPGGDRGDAAEELTAQVTVNGTTVMGIYEVKDDTVLLTSVDFGHASAALNGQAAEVVAAQLLREIAASEMARSGVHYMRDDEGNSADT